MKKLSRYLALVVAVLMLVSLSGIASAETNADFAERYTQYGRYPETIELTTVKRSDTNPTWAEGDSLDNNPMTRYIAEKLNVVTKTIWEVESTSFIEKLALDMVADTLPDMWTLGNNDYLVYRELLENGKIADMTEAYEKCRNWYLQDTAESFDNVHFVPYTEDGKLMGIPTGKYAYEHNQLWVRTDMLDEVGIKVEDIKTLDDIENVLTKFKEAFGDGDYVGMALNATDPLYNYGSAFSADQIAMVYGATPRYWLLDEEGKVTYGSIMPGMKEALGVLRDWYDKGLIDKEFMTRTGTGQTQALTEGGQTGLWFAPWWYGWNVNKLFDNVEGAEIEIINAPVDANGKYNVPWPSPAGDVLLVNANYEYPEAVVKVLNAEYDMWRGFDTEAKAELDAHTDVNRDPYQKVSWGYLFPTGGVNMEYANVVPTFGNALKAYCDNPDDPDTMKGLTTPGEINEAINVKAFMDGESVAARGSYYARYKASTVVAADNVEFVYPAYSQVTDSMADLKANLDTLEQTTFLKIITGEQELDAFDDFVNQWLAEGGQTLIDEVTALIAE